MDPRVDFLAAEIEVRGSVVLEAREAVGRRSGDAPDLRCLLVDAVGTGPSGSIGQLELIAWSRRGLVGVVVGRLRFGTTSARCLE